MPSGILLPSLKAEILNKKGWRSLEASKKSQIVRIPSRLLASTSHYILKAHKKLKEQIQDLKVFKEKVQNAPKKSDTIKQK